MSHYGEADLIGLLGLSDVEEEQLRLAAKRAGESIPEYVHTATTFRVESVNGHEWGLMLDEAESKRGSE